MKKVIGTVGAVVIVALAYVGSSWYVGSEAESSIRRTVQQTNERLAKVLGSGPAAKRFDIQIRSYDRGAFSSNAEYVIHTTDPWGEPVEYVLKDHLEHGPFPFSALRAGQFSPMLAYSQADMAVTPSVQKWFDPEQADSPLHITTQIGFGGKGTSAWTLAPVDTMQDQSRVSFSGGQLHLSFSNGFNDSVAQGHVDHFIVADTASGENVELRDITIDSTTTKLGQDQFDQSSTIKIDALTLAGDVQTEAVTATGLNVDLVSTQTGSLLDATLRYDLARVAMGDAELGQLTVGGAIKRLDVQALTNLQDAYAAIATSRGPDVEAGFDLTGDEQAELLQQVLPLLQTEPAVSLDPVIWKNAGGQSEASVLIQLQNPSTTENLNADELLRELVNQATVSLSISRSMVVQLFQQVGTGQDTDLDQAGQMGGLLFDQYADLLTQTGLMLRQDDTLTLSMDVTPATNQVALNGETMTTEQFMMLALGLLLLQ